MEIPVEKMVKIADKFLTNEEYSIFNTPLATPHLPLTILWSAKESVFKWYGDGGVDFRKHIQLQHINESDETINCIFTKTDTHLTIHYRQFEHLVLACVAN